jgi:hypothetical protein
MHGVARAPNKLHVYDAGYIKLREASLTYNFSAETLGNYLSPLLLFQSLEEIYGLSIRTLQILSWFKFWKCSRLSIWCILLLEKLEQVLNYSFKK